jgi:hypothetical protein
VLSPKIVTPRLLAVRQYVQFLGLIRDIGIDDQSRPDWAITIRQA